MSQGINDSSTNLIKTIRIASIKRSLWPIILAAFVCFFLVKIPFSDVLTSEHIDNISEVSYQNIDDVKYYNIDTQSWMYTGYDNYSDDDISEHIFYCINNDNCYLLFVDTEYVDTDTMTINSDSLNVRVTERTNLFKNFLTQFALDLNWNYESLENVTAPIVMNTVSYNTVLYKIMLGILLILLTYSIIVIIRRVSITLFPLMSSQFNRNHRHCDDVIRSRKEFASYLQAELNDYQFKASNLYITKNYLINLDNSEIYIIPTSKLCFVFEHGNLHKILWFYMKVTHTLYFLCSNGLKCHFVHKHSGNIDYIINMLKVMIPELMIGYSSEHQEKYLDILKQNKNGG